MYSNRVHCTCIHIPGITVEPLSSGIVDTPIDVGALDLQEAPLVIRLAVRLLRSSSVSSSDLPYKIK